MLDTNTVSYIIKGSPPTVRERLREVPEGSLCISMITKAKLLVGVERKPEAVRLKGVVEEFLLRMDVLPWESSAAEWYARLRTYCDKKGMPLGTMDMLIAAHAAAIGATLVSSDSAFQRIKEFIPIEDWTKPKKRSEKS